MLARLGTGSCLGIKLSRHHSWASTQKKTLLVGHEHSPELRLDLTKIRCMIQISICWIQISICWSRADKDLPCQLTCTVTCHNEMAVCRS